MEDIAGARGTAVGIFRDGATDRNDESRDVAAAAAAATAGRTKGCRGLGAVEVDVGGGDVDAAGGAYDLPAFAAAVATAAAGASVAKGVALGTSG